MCSNKISCQSVVVSCQGIGIMCVLVATSYYKLLQHTFPGPLEIERTTQILLSNFYLSN